MKPTYKFITARVLCIALLVCLFASCLVLAGCNFHRHDFENVWFSDEKYHWKKCSVCYMRSYKAEHIVAEDSWQVVTEPTETQPGLSQAKCTVCQYVISKEIVSLDHTHDFNGAYLSDEIGHWKECACGEKDSFETHVVTDWIIDVEATETTQGERHGICNVCSKSVTGTIPMIGHTHSYANVLSYDDTYHYYECSCGDQTEIALHDYSADWITDNEKHWKKCADCNRVDYEQKHVTTWIVDTPATTTSTGSKHEECTVCNKTLKTETIDKLTSSTRTVDFYGINDFHGTVDRMSATGGYLKQKKNNNANTVLINSGDMFQGSMESNSNYGKLLTDCMDAIGFDAFTFGNHEFDWGLEKLGSLSKNSNVPFLGANIYHWNASSKSWGTFASELAQEYVVKELDNGLKVGIIGVIGEDQITSISSNLVQTIGFKEPLPIIKTLATKLRSEQKCDVVVVSAHVGPQGLVGETENNQQPSSAAGLEQYVDAVFCAHTHRAQVYTVDGLPFIQGGSNGRYVSHVKLSVTNGSVTCNAQENISYSGSWPNISIVDGLINNANEQISAERNQVLATLDGSMNSNPDIPRLVSRAIAEYAKNQGYDISLAMVNTARSSLSYGQLTYSGLYEAIPFDNEVYIAKVKGSEIINEVKYSTYYWRSSGEAIESNKYYYIAVIDYLLFHQNAKRNYNYFPSAFTSEFTPVPLTNSNYDVYNYRLITRDYLLANSINVSDYTVDNNNTDTSLLQSTVTLTYQTSGDWITSSGGTTTNPDDPNPTPSGPTHAGTLADPYNVADALKVAAEYSSNTNAGNGYIVGKVSISGSTLRRGSTSDDLGGIYLVDDYGNKILVYWLSKFSGATVGNNWDWSDGGSSVTLPADLQEGDTIIIYAKTLFTYISKTPEVGSGFCLNINGVAVV